MLIGETVKFSLSVGVHLCGGSVPGRSTRSLCQAAVVAVPHKARQLSGIFFGLDAIYFVWELATGDSINYYYQKVTPFSVKVDFRGKYIIFPARKVFPSRLFDPGLFRDMTEAEDD